MYGSIIIVQTRLQMVVCFYTSLSFYTSCLTCLGRIPIYHICHDAQSNLYSLPFLNHRNADVIGPDFQF